MSPDKDEPTSPVAPVTCCVVTRVKTVMRMRVGSGQTVELSSGGCLPSTVLISCDFVTLSITSISY